MLSKSVKTQESKVLPLINTDDADLQNQKLTADQHGLPRIRKTQKEF
jgi:hypothetical protein